MREKISLRELFRILKKRLLLIITITAIFTATSGIISYFFLTPIYQSSTQILVNQSNSKKQVYDSSELQTNLQLINTYNVIIKSPAILDKVIKKEKLEMTSQALGNLVSVSNEQESQVVNIIVQYKDPQKAADITNTIATTFQSEIKSIMNADNVQVLTKAQEGSLVKPNPVLNVVIALLVGLMSGVSIAFLLEYLDNTFKKEQDVESHLGLPVLGAIAKINLNNDKKNAARGDTIGS
ncbi:YveK family protein [Priestia megaterium]